MATIFGLVLMGALSDARPGHAQPVVDLIGGSIESRASGALALLGLAAVPSETASTLTLDTGRRPDRGVDFRAGQFGGGFTFSDELPLYLEGYLGWNRYDPVFLASSGTEQRRLPVNWNSFAASGAIGWDFKLSDTIALRPLLMLALGTIASDATLGAFYVGKKLDKDVNFLLDGNLTAGGLGAALVLDYNRRWDSDWEVDLTLRQNYLYLEPIWGDRDVVGSAEAITTALWSRLRVPTQETAFGRPIRAVGEFSVGHYGGDQEAIFNSPWIAQVGLGAEIDVSETGVPWVTTARAVFRYTKGENLEGYALGFAVSF
ncbi:hypothetical protein PVT71_10820 [Salipiger sp. H15]|uniref:Autotransporter domain-containing protein n=1 Tax=Alloyangia sp. H15 TaxID=3029062 RepID=A0AAU8AE27_9RHOB